MDHLTYQQNEITGETWVKLGASWVHENRLLPMFVNYYLRKNKAGRRWVMRRMRAALGRREFDGFLDDLDNYLAALEAQRGG